MASDANSGEISSTQAENWLRSYGEAWETFDSDRVVAIFAAEASYRDNAFKPAMVGHDAIRNYWGWAAANQRDVKFESTLWGVSGPTAFAHWAAEFTEAGSGKRAKLDGVFHLKFRQSPDGGLLCEELLEWWFYEA